MDEGQVVGSATPLPVSQPSAPDGAHSGAPEGQFSPTVPADAGGQSPEGQEGQPGQPQPTVQDRINELTRHRRVAERVAAEAIEEYNREREQNRRMQAYIEGLRSGQVQPGGAPAQGQQQPDGPPDASQYNDWAAYTRDLARYEATQLMRQSRAEEMRAAQAAQQQQAVQMAQHAHRVREATINAAAEAGIEKYPDFAKAVSNPALPRIRDAHPSVVDALAYSENATDLMYYFGKNPAEAHRIIGLHPTLAIRELGKLEAKLGSGTVQLSNAPPPAERVRGGSNAPDPLSDRSNIDTWMKARNRQVHGRQ